jgi:hypothetical protein
LLQFGVTLFMKAGKTSPLTQAITGLAPQVSSKLYILWLQQPCLLQVLQLRHTHGEEQRKRQSMAAVLSSWAL